MNWLGYPRPDGGFGARNHVLVLPGGLVANQICHFVRGTSTITTPETGHAHTSADRETAARFLINLGRNANVAAVIVQGNFAGGYYPELSLQRLADEIAVSGKPVTLLTADECGGTLGLISRGIEVAREMVWQASRLERVPAPLGALGVGVKCGDSDATSGLVGNGAVGYLFDRLVDAGGVTLFGENTEIIGAEHVLAARAATPAVAAEILAIARKMEARGVAVGEDIRTINPVPSNFAGGISTLEEKSLGAIHKTGSRPVQGVLAYGERPKRGGLYFTDNTASGCYLFPGLAASGAQIVMFQLGGSAVPHGAILRAEPGLVAPLLWLTGNRATAERAKASIDYCSASVLDGSESLEAAGERLLQLVLQTASGAWTHTETIAYTEPMGIYYQEPIF